MKSASTRVNAGLPMVVPWLMPGIAIPGPWAEGQEPTGSSM